MRQADIEFLEDSFKRYYFDHFDLIRVPERTSEREFGFQKFGAGMVRHVPLKNDRELHLLLMKNVPSDIYCSNAYYSFPNLPMNEKDWKEADVIFDIDAKDLKLDCRKNHTAVLCSDCGAVSAPGGRCTECNSARLESKSLPCKDCIAASKAEVRRLSDILTQDLAIDPKDIHVYFSGNEGFHVYAYNSQFQESGSRERSELVDYIMFNGAVPETFGMKRNKPARDSFPGLDERGWRGRFAKEAFGSKSRRSKAITELLAGGYQSFQQKTLQDVSGKIGVKVDPGVTMDVHRIFRLPGSLNSKSGLAKTLCKDLDGFDPYVEASFLSDDAVQVRASCPCEFRLRNKKFGPYADDTVTVPTFAAAYMICKKLARIS